MADQMTAAPTMTNDGATASGSPASGVAANEAPSVGSTGAANGVGNQPGALTEQPAGKSDGKTTGQSTLQGAPEVYAFKAHEGREFDPEVMNSFSEVAKELNLSQLAAQKVVDKLAPKLQERQMAQIQKVQTQWAESSRQDTEFGGEHLQQNLSVAKKALDTFGTPELRQLLNDTGLGNNPEVIRFMYRAGKSISGDRFVSGATGGMSKNGPKSFGDAAAALYKNQN